MGRGRGRGYLGKKGSGEMGRGAESQAFKFCQLQSSGYIIHRRILH